MMSEREKQQRHAEQLAISRKDRYVKNWRFLCSDNFDFEAIASTERGAFRVLDAERPGVLAQTMGYNTVRFR